MHHKLVEKHRENNGVGKRQLLRNQEVWSIDQQNSSSFGSASSRAFHRSFLSSCKLNSSLCIAWEDSRLAASACRTALLTAAFAFAAETKLVRESFKISKLSFVRPEIFVPMLLKESSGLSDSAHVARCNWGRVNSSETTQPTISLARSVTDWFTAFEYSSDSTACHVLLTIDYDKRRELRWKHQVFSLILGLSF